MKRTIYLAIAGVLVSSTLYAGPAASDHEKGKKAKYEPVSNSSSSVSVRVVFIPREVRVIREYYGPRYQSLPPGLQRSIAARVAPPRQKRCSRFRLSSNVS
jgi:hypothetical protein